MAKSRTAKSEKKDVQEKDEKEKVSKITLERLCNPQSPVCIAYRKLLNVAVNNEFDIFMYRVHKKIQAEGGEEYYAVRDKIVKDKKCVDGGILTSNGIDRINGLNEKYSKVEIEIEPHEMNFKQKGGCSPADLLILEEAGIIKIKE